MRAGARFQLLAPLQLVQQGQPSGIAPWLARKASSFGIEAVGCTRQVAARCKAIATVGINVPALPARSVPGQLRARYGTAIQQARIAEPEIAPAEQRRQAAWCARVGEAACPHRPEAVVQRRRHVARCADPFARRTPGAPSPPGGAGLAQRRGVALAAPDRCPNGPCRPAAGYDHATRAGTSSGTHFLQRHALFTLEQVGRQGIQWSAMSADYHRQQRCRVAVRSNTSLRLSITDDAPAAVPAPYLAAGR